MNGEASPLGDKNMPSGAQKFTGPGLRLIAACSLLILNLTGGCNSGDSGGGTDPVDPNIPPVNAEVLIISVQDKGVVRVNPAILKRDAGFSALYCGRSVWLFGDTLLETPNAQNVMMMCNSMSGTYDIDAGDAIDGLTEEVDEVGAPKEFFSLTEEEKAFNARHAHGTCGDDLCEARWRIWPGTIVVDDSKETAYVFYRKILVESGLFNFSHVGHSIAVWKNYSEPPQRPVFNYIESYPTLFFAEKGDHGYGSAAVVEDEKVYVYGCELGEDELTKPCHLARVPLADILDRRAWSFYSGSGIWSSNPLESSTIFYGNDMMSVFFNAYVNRFIAIYSEPLGSTAMLRTAVRPEGPWSEPLEIFTVDAPENVYGWVYDFLAHPEFSEDDGRIIYVTYSKSIDQTHSELRLVAVELALAR